MSREELIVAVLVAWRSQSCSDALALAGKDSTAAAAMGRRESFIPTSLRSRRCDERHDRSPGVASEDPAGDVLGGLDAGAHGVRVGDDDGPVAQADGVPGGG